MVRLPRVTVPASTTTTGEPGELPLKMVAPCPAPSMVTLWLITRGPGYSPAASEIVEGTACGIWMSAAARVHGSEVGQPRASPPPEATTWSTEPCPATDVTGRSSPTADNRPTTTTTVITAITAPARRTACPADERFVEVCIMAFGPPDPPDRPAPDGDLHVPVGPAPGPAHTSRGRKGSPAHSRPRPHRPRLPGRRRQAGNDTCPWRPRASPRPVAGRKPGPNRADSPN